MLTRRALLAGLGIVAASASTDVGLPLVGAPSSSDHAKFPILTAGLRRGEIERINALPGDTAYEPQDFDEAIAVLAKYGCVGVILPDEVIEAIDGRRDLAPHGVEFFKRREIERRPIVSKPLE